MSQRPHTPRKHDRRGHSTAQHSRVAGAVEGPDGQGKREVAEGKEVPAVGGPGSPADPGHALADPAAPLRVADLVGLWVWGRGSSREEGGGRRGSFEGGTYFDGGALVRGAEDQVRVRRPLKMLHGVHAGVLCHKLSGEKRDGKEVSMEGTRLPQLIKRPCWLSFPPSPACCPGSGW
jgi:hypothetical protein